jgi:CheY-like chemotaxis protein
MMGGELTLASEVGVGSTMSIRLPLRNIGEERETLTIHTDEFSNVSHQPQGLSPAQDMTGETAEEEHKTWSVLLAEDDPIGRRVGIKRLQRAGFEVEAVADGALAWQRIQEQDFDLLLTDVRMPEMDGMELTRNIRKFEHENDKIRMIIIGLSAFAMEEVRQEAMQSGMDDFISKPVDMSSLMKKLDLYCANNQIIDNSPSF